MSIFHYMDWLDNFGDNPLNSFLLPKIFKTTQEDKVCKSDFVITGIGSILGIRPKRTNILEKTWLIFGTGFQYGKWVCPKRSICFALRGELTYSVIKKDIESVDLVFGDPGILLPIYYERLQQGNYRDIATFYKWDFKKRLKSNQFTTLCPNKRIDDVLCNLFKYKMVETDALHVAIIADAYGIPWKPLRWELKWEDHFSQLGIKQRPKDFVLSDRKILKEKQDGLIMASKKILNFLSSQ